MRFVGSFFLVLALFVGVVALGGPDRSAVFDDCTFHQSVVGAGVTLDTLWFTASQANAGAGLDFDGLAAAEISAWHPPKQVPVGANYTGEVLTIKRPVKTALLYSRVPFTYRAFANGETPRTWFDVADTTTYMSGNGTPGLEYPCWAIVSYPDSIYIAEAGGDSVQLDLGY